VSKRYRVTYGGRLSGEAVARCRAGIRVPDEERPYLPAELQLESQHADGGTCTLILHEGRYHQVKRMIHALGGHVTALHRDRIGALELPADLAPGTSRDLTASELAALQQLPADA
jgi:16S rRNA pseudouridine516 synthase